MSSVPCDLSASALSVSAVSTGAAYGGSGCAARVAQAFGEHPEAAVTRMRWARTLVARAIPAT
jgi:hypothetical protein